MDASNNVFVADTDNSQIREIVPVGTNWAVSTLASVNLPGGIAINGSSNLVVADSVDNTILNVAYSGAISTLAGISGTYGGADGTNATATFNYPQGTAVDANGVIYVADSLNNAVRKIATGGVADHCARAWRAAWAGPMAPTPSRASNHRKLWRSTAWETSTSPMPAMTPSAGFRHPAQTAGHHPRGAGWGPGNADGTNAGAQFYSPGRDRG